MKANDSIALPTPAAADIVYCPTSATHPLACEHQQRRGDERAPRRIAGFVTRVDLVPSFRHSRTVFTERQESVIL
jgi:hypothetical protein